MCYLRISMSSSLVHRCVAENVNGEDYESYLNMEGTGCGCGTPKLYVLPLYTSLFTAAYASASSTLAQTQTRRLG
jgi:hypothetical protein